MTNGLILTILASAIVVAAIYLFIGYLLGAYMALKMGYKKPEECDDILEAFAVKWPKILWYGINIYFEEREKKQALKKQTIYYDTSR